MDEKPIKFRVEVYMDKKIYTFIDVYAKDKEEAEKLVKDNFKSPITFKAKKY